MRDELLQYYERELAYLRRMGATFAQRYPKVASRLLLEPNKCDDPHVERLLEGFAFLAARVHLKLDDDFPELSESLLSVAYPQYLRPVPSMSIAEFTLDPEQGKLTTGLSIPRGSQVQSRPVGGVACKFRTCYDTTLWPVSVTSVQCRTPDQLRPAISAADAVLALRVELQGYPDVTFSKLQLNTLRFHLNGDSNLVSTLYELLSNNCVQIVVRETGPNPKRPVVLPADSLRPVGFGADEGMLPMPRRSMAAFSLLQEYFTFPEKFYFFDLDGFDRVRAAGFGSTAEVVFLISAFERPERRTVLESGVSARTMLLGCAPIVNLFEQTSEPIALTPTHYEYPVVADARRRETTRIFSINEVTAARPGSPEVVEFQPLYSHRHARNPGQPEVFWAVRRQVNEWEPGATSDLYLSFADLSGRPARPDQEAATARTTCYNGDLPSRLPFGDEQGDFTLLGGGPIQKIVALVKPTQVIEAPLGKPLLWRLISQLSLNYVSLVDGGADALGEVLRLHNFGGSAAGEKQIQGIVDVRSEPCYTRVHGAYGLSFARGHRVAITFDEEQFAGGGVFLLASVIDRFLGVYTTLNSFCILVAHTRQRREALREWPARAGWKALV